jgi:hypothetical protein
MMDDLVVTVTHLLDELNVSNDVCGRSNHLFQVVEFWQGLCDILNEYINNDGEDTDSTYQIKLQQLIDNVLSYDQPSRINDSPGMATLTTTMTDSDVVVEEEEDAGNSNNTLESSELLHEIYGDEVFNKANNLIVDAPSLLNSTQGIPLRQKRRRLESWKISEKRSNVRKQKEWMKGDYTY